MKKALLPLLASLFLLACGRDEPAPGPPAAATVKTAPVEMRELETTYSAEATIEAGRQSTVAAQVTGRIVEVRFDVGDHVKQGEIIVRIDESLAARAVQESAAQVAEAQAALANARSEYERSRQLLAQKFISQAGFDKAEATYRAAQARVTALLAGAGQAVTERSFSTLRAPYTGIVSQRHVEVGEMATPGKPLMSGFDPATLRVVTAIPLTQVTAVQAGAKARVEVPSLNRWIDVVRVNVLPSADPRTHTTQVRLQLPADVRGVYPGLYARAHFVTGRARRLVVPRAAVLRRSEVTAVYVLSDRNILQLRQIRLGTEGDEHFVEVLAGLKAGERVAIEPIKAAIEGSASVRAE